MSLGNIGSTLLLAGFALVLALPAGAAIDKARAAAEVKAAIATTVAGINAHDPAKAAAYDAPDVVSMEGGRPDVVGSANDLAGFKMVFGYEPDWRVSLIEESVDVADSGEMAVYRSTYNEDSISAGVPVTHRVHLIAGFRRGSDGRWEMPWYVVSPLERSHKK